MKRSIKVKIFIVSLFAFLFQLSVHCQKWQIVTPKYATNDAIVAGFVADAATYGNGATDATSYLQDLLNQLDNYTGDPNHGGGVVYLPEGRYRIDGTLIIPKGITLRGDWQKPVKGQPVTGTVLMAYSGKGDAGGTPFITMEPAAAVMDLAIWYPEQDADNITPYPHAIQFGRPNYFGNEFCNAKNITLVNAYSGIYFYQGGGTCPTINGIYGTPLKQGVEIDRIVDIGRIEWCDFSPAYWAGSGLEGAPSLSDNTYTNWIYNNGTGVVMRRNDWSYTCYLSVEGYNKGFYATQSLQADNGYYSTPNGHNYGFNLKDCKYGLYFEGRANEGCMFTEVKTEGCEYGAYIAANAAGVLQLYKWNITSDATDFAVFSDKTASTKMTFQESTVNSGKVRLQGGTFIAMDNDFNNDAPQIEFELNSRGNILGNRFKDNDPQISQNSVFENQIDHDPVTVKELPDYVEFVPQSKKPDRNVMYNVLDYGVQKGTRNSIPGADATSGIQSALNDASEAGGGLVYLPPGHYRINGSLTIPSNVELKGSIDVSAFPMGPGSILEIYSTTENPVKMQAGSGIRGVVFNYPGQVLCTVLPDPVQYPYAIQVQGSDAYIVNVGMRAAYRGVDLFTYACDNFYIDFLTGYFFKEGVNIKNSKDGILANMQCNTIVYNCGDESKFGGFPNSNRPDCSDDESKDPYLYNSKNLNFLTMENVEDIFLYNDFNYNTLNGIVFKDNVSGTAVGFALDDDRTGLLVDGSNVNFDFVNLQDVALHRGTEADGKSSYIKTTSNFTSGSLNIFNSDYWGYASSSGIVMDGAGTVSLQSGNFMHSGVESFANVNDGQLEINASVVNGANNNNPLYSGAGLDGVFTQGSLLDPTGTSTSSLGSWTNNMSMGAVPSAESALDRTGWVATASYSSDGSTPQQGIDGNATTRWTSGWQSQGTGQGAVWYQVDMGSEETFNQIILDYANSPNDGPQTYILEVSADGTEWTQVASGESSTQMTIIPFEEQTARYFRITKPASTKTNYWAIHELYVFDVTATEEDPENTPYGGTPAPIPGVIEAENYDLGGQDLAYSDTTPENEGGQYRTSEGVDVEICQNGGYDVGYTAAGEWIKYTVNVASGSNYTLEAVVASGNSGSFYVAVDDIDITGTQTVATGDWQTWDTLKVTNIPLTTGLHEVVFYTNGGMNLDKFIFTEETPPYGGIPFNGPHDIYDGAILEAEDFDDGGEDVAYHDQEAGPQNSGQSIVYRPDEDVEVESYAPGEYNIGFTNNGEWTNYSVNVTTAGKYDIGVVVASGNDNGRFKLLLDNTDISGDISFANTGGWSTWDTVTVSNVALTSGAHIFTWYTYGGMNLDKFIFTEAQDQGEDLIPVYMENPLFTEFDSPLYGTSGTGRMWTADPSAHVWKDGRLYVYASHDMEPALGCDRMDRYHVFSTDDMKNWVDHGEILNASQVSWGRTEGGFMWAPDCAYNPENQTYYFYFPHPSGTDWGSTWKIGIATSSQPASGFTVQGYIEGLESLIDPCVFVDDDGQPYLYHGGGGRCMGGKLDKNDWTKLDGTMTEMQGLVDFHEAAWVHKYNGKYYLSYSDNHGNDGNQLKYAMSDNPLGPWTDMGVYLYATGCDTHHGSIVEYKGQWYAFYHTSNASGQYNLRSVCADPLYYNSDGSIQVVQNWGTPFNGVLPAVVETDNTTDVALTLEAEDFNDGGSHYGYWDKDSENLGGNTVYRPNVGVDIESRANDVVNIGRMENGEWLRYSINVEKAGLYDVDCVVASGNAEGGSFHLSVNGTRKTGEITVPFTSSDWDTWTTVTAENIPLQAGEQYIDMRTNGGFNFDKFQFRKSAPYQGTPYNGPHNVPGTIEAEDFDDGGSGVAYYDTDAENKSGAYRTDEGVDIENSNGNIHISWTSGGEWTKYTINVTEIGTYDISIPVSTGNGAAGSLYLTFDDVYNYPVAAINTGSWNDYETLTVSNVNLEVGTHVMTLNIVGNINVDKFLFEKRLEDTFNRNARIQLTENINVYPNPSDGIYVISIKNNATVNVVDIKGVSVYAGQLKGGSDTIDLTSYPSGIYFASVFVDGKIYQLKLIKK